MVMAVDKFMRVHRRTRRRPFGDDDYATPPTEGRPVKRELDRREYEKELAELKPGEKEPDQ